MNIHGEQNLLKIKRPWHEATAIEHCSILTINLK